MYNWWNQRPQFKGPKFQKCTYLIPIVSVFQLTLGYFGNICGFPNEPKVVSTYNLWFQSGEPAIGTSPGGNWNRSRSHLGPQVTHEECNHAVQPRSSAFTISLRQTLVIYTYILYIYIAWYLHVYKHTFFLWMCDLPSMTVSVNCTLQLLQEGVGELFHFHNHWFFCHSQRNIQVDLLRWAGKRDT